MISARRFSHPYDGLLHPESTALLVIDLQENFLSSTGCFARSGYDPTPLRAIFPAMSAWICNARSVGCRWFMPGSANVRILRI
ncbi:hypothetical protein SAMN05216605_11770 [Pseudomonas abietaniphila]|uniref:Nicotinamidase-related amidase n=1 Tax=Pseudomonas abietaniphila TaxID=89065 RepID=A0A1G8NG53_9PSED|nr:hypothetical protein SAMN05216605_11770 [Pseudomonas abietaniphila]